MTASALALEADIEPIPFSNLSLQWREIADAARTDIDTLLPEPVFAPNVLRHDRRPSESRCLYRPLVLRVSMRLLATCYDPARPTP